MAYTHFIPKIEWLKGTESGTTSIGSPTVASMVDTSDIAVGMFFEGTGIPAGALVVSKTATSVTLDKNATTAATNTFSFGNRIEFEYPPKKDPIGENPKWVGSVATAKSGVVQYIEDFIEIEYKLEFSHVSQTIKDAFNNFLLTHALRGGSFSFFHDKNEPTSEMVVEKNDNYTSPSYKIITRKGAGFNYSWSFKFEFRRVHV